MASSSSNQWRARPGCHQHLVQALEHAVNSEPMVWRERPVTGEQFNSLVEAESRLLVWALVEGFDIVRRGGGNKVSPASIFICIHHGVETRNSRGLATRVIRDNENNIISDRKREATVVRQTDCKWSCRVSFKPISRKDKNTRKWILTVNSLNHHGHYCTESPLAVYPRHLARTEEFKQAKATATQHREAIIAYSASRRVLESNEYGVTLTSKQYYNTVRKAPANAEDMTTIVGLLQALEDNDFIHQTRVELAYDIGGKVVGRKMQQIWFSHPRLLDLARRFVSDFILIIDGTFNTNRYKLPLLVAVGVLNSGKTFPIAYSWCQSESKVSYGFFWSCLKEECFERPGEPHTVPPRVILGDQHQGITSSIPDAFPDAQQQFCDWHAVSAMVTKMGKIGIPSDLIKTKKDADKQEIPGLRRACWDYLKSRSDSSLITARDTLKEKVKSAIPEVISKPEKREEFSKYIDNEWYEKESKVVHYYTMKYANLGSTSSQRGESYHDVVREVTNGQLSLKDAAERLCQKALSSLKDIETDEASSHSVYSRLAQSSVFIDLRMKVSRRALTMVEKEWSEMSQILASGNDIVVDGNGCECELILRFGIACRHYLKRAFMENIPLPKTLLHPRWWLNGPDIYSTNWRPFYPSVESEPTPSPAIPLALQISQIRSELAHEEARRYDA